MDRELNNIDLEKISQLAAQWWGLVKAVVAEVNECNTAFSQNNVSFSRRMQCRSIFASIEALTYNLKQYALMHTVGYETFFTEAERLALSDLSSDISDQGEVIAKRAKIRLIPNVLLALKSFSRICGQDFPTPNNDPGWDALKRAIKVRDRITHPKTAADFVINDNEYQDTHDAWLWFSTKVVEVTQPAREAAERVLKEKRDGQSRASENPGNEG